MKLIDGKSKMGQKLEKWLPQHQRKSKQTEQQKKKFEESNQKRNQLPSAHDPETKLEGKIKKWFTAAEEGDRPLIIEERVSGAHRQILVITYHRAILFEAGFLGRLKDVSDKIWRQFVSVHLTEKIFSSSLRLRFFPYHDSISYHNPYKENSSVQEDDFKNWHLDRLNKEEARRVYAFLKDKELYWQEKRRQENIVQRKMPPMRPPGGGGGAPPPKKD
ncbi:hypothetical protein VT98_11092 [Candidatus Electrothrix communis]|uniref:Uncharacterized protein n=1 Tax=Candidatus Electrothrix communis TaxID=1859133 RepID=A0A444J6Z5_9BACT|nr:hypothetical protein [Desulfobulbus sp. US4]RWX48799.1 hypothetical protein VT98_11092 [Candidatus Electrothrix communis]WLE96848.1 MAG: hypothetical protein QTN59_19490 [Candidatus Electrothrix communis]